MNVSLCCHRLCICYSKYNLVSRVSSKCNHTALLKNCVSLRIIYIYIYIIYIYMYIYVYEPSLFRHVFKVTLM